MFKSDDDDVEESGDEPLEYTNLQKAIMLRDVFWQCGGDPAAVERKYKDALSVAQMDGLAPVGTFADAAGIVHRQLINGWIEKAARAGAGDLAQWQDIRIGRADESFQADRLVDAIALDVEVKRPGAAPYKQRVNLYGRVQNVSPKLDAVMQEVARKDLAAKHVLPLVMESIALCAAGEAIDPNFRVIIVGDVDGPAWVRQFAPMSREAARQYLSNLASELLSGGTNYFLPIEAVADVVAAQRKGKDEIVEQVEAWRDDVEHYCSSDSGPLRKTSAHDFEPPKLDQLIAIIHERFLPIAGIFDQWSRPR